MATFWIVGPNLTYATPSQVAPLVGDGDTINILAGTYPSDVTNWTADDLLIRGVGGFAHMESNGNAWGGKAIWVIQGDRTTVENIEFSECSVPDMNGAGIRQEGHHLTVRNCYFHHNENGILAGTLSPSNMTIEHTEFSYNGYGDGQSHNLYINNIDTLFFRHNYSHHAHVGHELKSRAHVNFIEYNRFSNETDGDASREIDLPNGGQVFLIGNVIQQGPMSPNSNMVGYGLEGLTNPGPHQLHAVNNTMVNEQSSGSFFSFTPNGVGTQLLLHNNILAGYGDVASPIAQVTFSTGNVQDMNIANLLFADAANHDYHITASSPAASAGFPAGYSNSGYPLVAWYEYVHPVGKVTRCQHATLDVGAFEHCTVNTGPIIRNDVLTLSPNPADDLILVRWSEQGGDPKLILTDIQGRQQKAPVEVHDDRAIIHVEHLPPGIYVLYMGAGDSAVSKQVIVR